MSVTVPVNIDICVRMRAVCVPVCVYVCMYECVGVYMLVVVEVNEIFNGVCD